MVRDLINKHNVLISKSISTLFDLKSAIEGTDSPLPKDRIQRIVSDIERCIEYANCYLSDEKLYDPNVFRYDSTLINFTDTLRYDDSFGPLSEFKNQLCEDLVSCAKDLIALNNALR